MPQQFYIMGGLLVVIAIMVFTFSRTLKKHDEKMKAQKKKKGRSKYIQQYKNPGKK